MFLRKNTIGYALGALLLSVGSAQAAGFQLGEQSVTGLGRAFAGGGVVGDDLSAIVYNPAGMSLAKGTQVQAGTIAVRIESKLHGEYYGTSGALEASGSTKLDDTIPIPNFFVTHQVNDKLNLGFGVFSGYGFDLEYDENWFGAAQAVGSNIQTINLNPTVSYKINDEWSVGFGLSAERASARLSSATSAVKADSWAYGYDIGVMYEPRKDTRFGLSYRSMMKHKLDGEIFVPYLLDVYANLDLPDYATLGAYHKVNDWLALSGTVRWTHWEKFKELKIQHAGSHSVVSYVPENWQDTWYTAIGADFFIDDKLTLRVGWAHDTSPVKNNKFRTARVPDTYRYIVSVGASYKWNENLTFDVGYMHVFFPNASLDNHTYNPATGAETPAKLDAVYKSQLDLVGFQMQYKF